MSSHAGKTSFLKTQKPVFFWKKQFYLHGSTVLEVQILKQKPVLAREREARLKEERGPNESQKTSPDEPKATPKVAPKWLQNGAQSGPKIVQGAPKMSLKS